MRRDSSSKRIWTGRIRFETGILSCSRSLQYNDWSPNFLTGSSVPFSFKNCRIINLKRYNDFVFEDKEHTSEEREEANINLSIKTATPERGLLSRGTEAPRQRERKKESEIGKFKKLKAMLQKRIKTDKNKCCGLRYAV